VDKQLHVNIQSHNLAKRKKGTPLPIRKSPARIMRLWCLNIPEPLLLEYCAVTVPKVQKHSKWRGDTKKKPENI